MEYGQDFRIFVLSDGTGQTGKRVLEAALLQFDQPVMIIRIPNVSRVDEVREVVAEAAHRGGMIVYTLVAVDLRQALHVAAAEQEVIAVDLLGGMLSKFQDFLQRSPWGQPGLLHHGDEPYLERVEAMEFTIQHDDGRMVEDLAAADLVLVGTSRTSKTPVSFYLAYRGWKVANVPTVLGIAPPETLRGLDSGSIVGLTIDAERLALIRRARAQHLGLEKGSSYTDLDHIRDELRYSVNLCKAYRWPVVDVTRKAVEETAKEIISLVMPRSSDLEKHI